MALQKDRQLGSILSVMIAFLYSSVVGVTYGDSVCTHAYTHQQRTKPCRLIYQCLLSAFLVTDLISADSCLGNTEHPAGRGGLDGAETALSRLPWLHLL